MILPEITITEPILTFDKFKELGYEDHDIWRSLEECLQKENINTALRIAHFLAQVTHECQDFKRFEENLNYSEQRLLQVFPKYFNRSQAKYYARKPELIANRVYANRGGNGPESSGDGYKYCGRGGIMVTFKDNYKALSKDTGIDFKASPWLLKDSRYALVSAGWFWGRNGLNKWADEDSLFNVSKMINNPSAKTSNGVNGYEDRAERLKRFKARL